MVFHIKPSNPDPPLSSSVSHPSSALSAPLQVTARVISSCPLSSVCHLAANHSINQFIYELYQSITSKEEMNHCCVYQREMQLCALERWPADLSRARETAHRPVARGCSAAAPPPQPRRRTCRIQGGKKFFLWWIYVILWNREVCKFLKMSTFVFHR